MTTPLLNPRTALVILSGGQDSTTCLYWAKALYREVHAVTFDYQQRHRREIEAASKVAQMAGVGSHEVIRLGPVLTGSSPLVSGSTLGRYDRPEDMPGGIEPTFVPARNLLFLTIAANRAHSLRAGVLVTGVSQEDYGGYPDCRAEFIAAMQSALGLGLVGDHAALQIATPLINLTKLQTVEMAQQLPGCLDALAYSHTCYGGQYPPDPKNHASILRAKGFRQAGIADPLITRAKSEGLLPADYPADGYVFNDVQTG